MSIAQKLPSVPSDDEVIPVDSDSYNDGEMSEEEDSNDELNVSREMDMERSSYDITPDDMQSYSQEEECCDINVDNLDSVRNSIVCIADFCMRGGQLNSWQQQKIAIAMDNLAEVARRLH